MPPATYPRAPFSSSKPLFSDLGFLPLSQAQQELCPATCHCPGPLEVPPPALLSRPRSRGQAHREAGSGAGEEQTLLLPSPFLTLRPVPHLVPLRSSSGPPPALNFSSQATVFVVHPTRLKIPDRTFLSEVQGPLPFPPQVKQPSPGVMGRKYQRARQLAPYTQPKALQVPLVGPSFSPTWWDTLEASPQHEPQDMSYSKGASVCTRPSQTPGPLC